MKNNRFNLITTFLAYILIVLAKPGLAQKNVTLRISDPAPRIEYSKWLKGEPVESFQPNDIYVLEFWATWCGPCKAAMPGLTKTQKEYGEKIHVIGVNVWEKVDDDKLYESVLPAVEKFVKGNDEHMGYSVVVDNNEEHMGKNWLDAAGQRGIPATFIVKDKKIIWIGHPVYLDSTLELIMKNKYDMTAYKTMFDDRLNKSLSNDAQRSAILKPINEAIENKEFDKAFKLMETGKKELPILAISLDLKRFITLLKEVGEEEAIEFGEEWQTYLPNASEYMLIMTEQNDGLSKDTYNWVIQMYDRNIHSQTSPMMYNIKASVYAKAGDYVNAIKNQESAIEGAKTALKEGKLVGSIMDYTVSDYTETLEKYKKLAKNEKK